MKCKICKERLRVKYIDQEDIGFHSTTKKFNWLQCENCNTLTIYPSQDELNIPEKLDEYYTNYQPHSGAIKITKNLSLNDRLSLNIKFIQKLFLENSEVRVIDLGCGKGDMLANLRAFFPNARLYGLDYNISSAQANLMDMNISLFEGDLDSLDIKHKFDIIISSQLLEHLDDPYEYIKFIKKHSHKETYTLTDIPNIQSRSYKIFKKTWVHLDTPRHRNLLTAEALSILFKEFDLSNLTTFGTNYAYISSFKLKYNLPIHHTTIPAKGINFIINFLLNIFLAPDDKIHFSVKAKAQS